MSRRALFGATALITGYVVLGLALWGATPAAQTNDSYRYFGSGDFSWPAIFEPLNGGIATSFLYAIAHNETSISLIQVLVSITAWSLLALAVLSRLRGRWTGWVIAGAVLLFSLQPAIWSSHFALASESLTFATAALWIASIVWLADAHRGQVLPLVGTTGAMALLALTRPQAMLAIVPIQLVILVWWSRREHSRLPGLATGLALLPFVAFAGVRVWQIMNHDRWPFRYALANLVDKTDSFRAYALDRMPACDLVPAALDGPAPWTDALALEGTLLNACPETYLWFQSDATSAVTWTLAIPQEALANFLQVMPNLSLVSWNDQTALPQWLFDVILPNGNPWPLFAVSLIAGIVLAMLSGRQVRITALGITGLTISVLSIVGVLFGIWASDGVDLGRHVYPIIPLISVAALVLPATIPSARSRALPLAQERQMTATASSP
jgi:hypothetical protein